MRPLIICTQRLIRFTIPSFYLNSLISFIYFSYLLLNCDFKDVVLVWVLFVCSFTFIYLRYKHFLGQWVTVTFTLVRPLCNQIFESSVLRTSLCVPVIPPRQVADYFHFPWRSLSTKQIDTFKATTCQTYFSMEHETNIVIILLLLRLLFLLVLLLLNIILILIFIIII